MSVYKLVCPACRSAMRIRSSEGQTPCFRSLYFQCTSLTCGATFSGSLSIEYALSPSGHEKPLVTLPVAPAFERMKATRDQRANTHQQDLLDQLEA